MNFQYSLDHGKTWHTDRTDQPILIDSVNPGRIDLFYEGMEASFDLIYDECAKFMAGDDTAGDWVVPLSASIWLHSAMNFPVAPPELQYVL